MLGGEEIKIIDPQGVIMSLIYTNKLKRLNNSFDTLESVKHPNELKQLAGADPRSLYIVLPTFDANPFSLLGQIVKVDKIDNNNPHDLSGVDCKFIRFPVTGYDIDENSKLKNPIQRSSLVISSKVAVKSKFLSYLDMEISDETVLSLLVFDRAIGRVNQQSLSWENSIAKWEKKHLSKFIDNTVYLFLITGFVQKEIIRKKYKKIKAGSKIGAYALSVDGELHSSNEEFSLDVVYGLEATILFEDKKSTEKQVSRFKQDEISKLMEDRIVENEINEKVQNEIYKENLKRIELEEEINKMKLDTMNKRISSLRSEKRLPRMLRKLFKSDSDYELDSYFDEYRLEIDSTEIFTTIRSIKTE